VERIRLRSARRQRHQGGDGNRKQGSSWAMHRGFLYWNVPGLPEGRETIFE
jgi:hypothetical protein